MRFLPALVASVLMMIPRRLDLIRHRDPIGQ